MSLGFKRVNSAPSSLQEENLEKVISKRNEIATSILSSKQLSNIKFASTKKTDSESKSNPPKHRSRAPRFKSKESGDKSPAKITSKIPSMHSFKTMDKSTIALTRCLSAIKDVAYSNPSNRNMAAISPNRRMEVANMANDTVENILGRAAGDADSKLLNYSFKCLRDEMRSLLKQSVDNEDFIKSLEERLKEADKNFSDIRKKCIFLEKSNGVLEKTLAAANEKCDVVSQDLVAANSYIADAKREITSGPNKMDLEKKVGRLMSDNAKLRREMESMKKSSKAEKGTDQRNVEDLRFEIKLLKQQKSELLEVVEKHAKLVNNLRRQVLHLKAGEIHKYTEEEIASAFDSFA